MFQKERLNVCLNKVNFCLYDLKARVLYNK